MEQEGVHILVCPRNIPMSVAPYWVRETKTWTYSPNQNWMYDASFVSLLI